MSFLEDVVIHHDIRWVYTQDLGTDLLLTVGIRVYEGSGWEDCMPMRVAEASSFALSEFFTLRTIQ
jgi:hypothetical protein